MKLDLGNPAWQTTLPPQRTVPCDAPVAACAFSRDGATVGFGLGDGRVQLLPADIKQPASAIAEPVHKGAVLSLIGDPTGDGFISGGDDGRLLRLALDGDATEIANQKGKWIDKLAAHPATGAIAASVGKMALVVDKAGAVREFGPHPLLHGRAPSLKQSGQQRGRKPDHSAGSSSFSSAIFLRQMSGAVVWTFSPLLSTATVTGKSFTSNS